MTTYFELRRPKGPRSAVMVEVPHAGTEIPEVVGDEITVPRDAILRDADIYVDELYQDAPEVGAPLLVANVSRYVVDLNRARDDVDLETVSDHPTPRRLQPRGVVWRVTTDGRPALARPLTFGDLERRLELFHTPYHAALEETLVDIQRERGFAILVAAHSMPSLGRKGHADPGARRADVVPGTLGRSTAAPEVIDLVDAHFRAAGLSIRHDDPYRGGFTTAHHGRPREHRHAIQIELNRALYVNEANGERYPDAFVALRSLVAELVRKLGELDLKAR